MLTLDISKVEDDAKVLVNLTMRELVINFGKSQSQAGQLVKKVQIFQSLIGNPQGLHESPHQWALIALSETNDIDTLEKYYSTH